MNSYLYDISIRGRKVIRNGTFHLDEQDSVLSGNITLAGYNTHFESGKLDGVRYSFHTHLHTSAGNQTCDVIFYRTDKQIIGGVITPRGCWELTGGELSHQTNSQPYIRF